MTDSVPDSILSLQLQERKRLRKQSKTKENAVEQKESNFNIYFNGANTERVKLQKIRAKQRPDGLEASVRRTWLRDDAEVPAESDLEQLREESVRPRPRAKWMIKSIEIKGDAGPIRARPAGVRSFLSNYGPDIPETVEEEELECELENEVTLAIRKKDLAVLRSSIDMLQLKNDDDVENKDELSGDAACAEVLHELGQNDADEIDDANIEMIVQKISSMNRAKRKLVAQLLQKLDDGDLSGISDNVWKNYEEFAPKNANNVIAACKSENVAPINDRKVIAESTGLEMIPSESAAKKSYVGIPKSPLSVPHSQFLIELSANDFVNRNGMNATKNGCPTGKTSWQVVIRIFSSWGHPYLVGLTELELLDSKNVKIRLAPSCLMVEGRKEDDPSQLVSLSRVQLARMINGHCKTTNERNMWLTSFPLLSDLQLACIDLTISYVSTSRSTLPSFLKLWNYNRSPEDSIKGVKKFEVWLNSDCVYRGELQQGPGNQDQDYFDLIPLTGNDMSVLKQIESPLKKVPLVIADQLQEEEFEQEMTIRESFVAQDACQLNTADVSKEFSPDIQYFIDSSSHLALNEKATPLCPDEKLFSKTNFANSELGLQIKSRPSSDRKSLKSSKSIIAATQELQEKEKVDQIEIAPSDANSRSIDFQHPNLRNSSLRESMDSLSFFEQNHIGRLNVSTLTKSDFESKFEKRDPIMEEAFSIPVFPSGKQVLFNIKSTWGDAYYVGLCGIEFFDQSGELISINPDLVTADPSSINILEEYGNDPRVVSNLVDGINATCDDMHAWLTPFTSGQAHLIRIDLGLIRTLSMIRIWNYNKSRIHSSRGARELDIFLDSKLIFRGEISSAPGEIFEASQYAEVILFTSDAELLDKLAYEVDRIDAEQLYNIENPLEIGNIDDPISDSELYIFNESNSDCDKFSTFKRQNPTFSS